MLAGQNTHQRKIPWDTNLSKGTVNATSRPKAYLILATRKGLMKVFRYCVCTLYHTDMCICICVCIHTICFFSAKLYPWPSCLKTAGWTLCLALLYKMNLLAYHLDVSSGQEQRGSMCHNCQLYIHVSDIILFLTGKKYRYDNYLLGMPHLLPPVNQQRSTWLALQFFKQATGLTKASQHKVGTTTSYRSHSFVRSSEVMHRDKCTWLPFK